MKNQLSLIIASATLALTSAILPVGAYEKHKQAGLMEIYPNPTDAVIVAENCAECTQKLNQCGISTSVDFAIDPLGFIRDIAKGKYDTWDACKWINDHDCSACPERKGFKPREAS
jgi:hypothetical protein